MQLLSRRVAGHRTLGLDAAIFIYFVEAHPRYLRLARTLVSGIQAGRWAACTSTVTLMELTVHPWRVGRGDVAQDYEAVLAGFPNLVVADVTRDIARRAAQLRARHNIQPLDALQVATALVYGATAFVTNDRGLMRVASELDVIILEDHASQR